MKYNNIIVKVFLKDIIIKIDLLLKKNNIILKIILLIFLFYFYEDLKLITLKINI